jgi:hypothetical protein
MTIITLALSLILPLILLAAFLSFPLQAESIAMWILVLIFGVSIGSILLRHIRQYRAGELDRRSLVRNIGVEITARLLVLGLSIFPARLVFAYFVAKMGSIQGLVLGMAAAALIGVIVGVLVQVTWGRLVDRSGLVHR